MRWELLTLLFNEESEARADEAIGPKASLQLGTGRPGFKLKSSVWSRTSHIQPLQGLLGRKETTGELVTASRMAISSNWDVWCEFLPL